MGKIGKFEIVPVHFPGAPIDGRQGTVLDEELRADVWHYFVDIEGEDCTWILPESALEPTGQIEDRRRGWDGSKFVEWDLVEITHPRQIKERFRGSRGVIQGKTLQEDIWWYTVELDSGEVLVTQEAELILIQEARQ